MTISGREVYLASRGRLLAQITELDDAHLVPATPAWDLRTLVSHLVGVAADVGRGAVDGYATDAWTDVQVAARATRDRAELLAEWDAVLPALLAVLAAPAAHGLAPIFELLPVADLLGHEHDVRESVGIQAVADDDAWTFVEPRRRDVLDAQVRSRDLPAIEVRTPDGDAWTVGSGSPAGQVTAPRYELWRSLEGRRTRDAVRAFDWTVDSEPYLAAWPAAVFSYPEDCVDPLTTASTPRRAPRPTRVT